MIIIDEPMTHPSVSQITHMSSEWSQGRAEEMKQYMEDIQTIKPSTITHPGETHLLHYDSRYELVALTS